MFISSISRGALVPLLGWLVAGLTLAPAAYGQHITPDPGGESCQVTPKCEPHKYHFLPDPGQTFHHWQVRGDLKLLSPADQNPAEVCSDGYGKGRLTAHYYTWRKADEKCRERCPDTIWHTLDYDLFKRFEAPDPIHGTTCVMPGQEVTFWVLPILTDWPHRNTGIGTDSYFWSGFPAGSVVNVSGDSSAITLNVPAGTPAFILRCQLGRCNKSVELLVNIGPALPSLASLPTCIATNDTTVVVLAFQPAAGASYRVSYPTGWSIQPISAGTAAGYTPAVGLNPAKIKLIPNGFAAASGGEVGFAVTGAGCSEQSGLLQHVARSLVATILPSPAPSGGCYVKAITGSNPVIPGTTYTFTLSTALPSGSAATWAVPTGWVINAGQGTASITATPGLTAVAGNITVATGGCAVATTLAVTVTSSTPSAGCLYTANWNGCGTAGLIPSGCTSTMPSATYLFELIDASVAGSPVVVETLPGVTHPTLSATFVRCALLPTALVRVRVLRGCFNAAYTTSATFAYDRCCGPRPASGPGTGGGGVLPESELRAYPNPAGSQVSIDLPQAKGSAKLTLTDGAGRVVVTTLTDKAHCTVDVSKLPVGLYVLRAVLADGKTLTQSVQVQH